MPSRKVITPLIEDMKPTKSNLARKKTKLSKYNIEEAKIEGQIRKIKRQYKLAAINEYIGFGVSKVIGTLGLVVGGIEWLDPDILPVILKNPEIVAGVGLALLTGKSIITLIAKVEKTFGREK
jgi:hypothetical protein